MSCGAFAECLDPAIYTSLTRPGIKGWGVLLMVGKSLLANGWASLAGNAIMQCKLEIRFYFSEVARLKLRTAHTHKEIPFCFK